MKYKLNQIIHAVDRYSDHVASGTVRSIQSTIFEPNELFPEGSTYVQYLIHNTWHYEDCCFDNKKEANLELIKRLEKKLGDSIQRLKRLRNEKTN